MTAAAALRVPDDLAELDQWVVWRAEPRNGKATKIPFQIDGTPAKSNDPQTWNTFAAVSDAWRKAPAQFEGVGFVFSANGSFTGIDLDDCLDAGRPKPWAVPIIECFADTYMEISPSGRGVKIFVRARLPGAGHRETYESGAIEIYDRGRFFTVTGKTLNGAPLQIEDHQQDVTRLYDRISKRASNTWPKAKADLRSQDAIPEGKRYEYLQSAAAQLRFKGFNEEEIYAAISSLNNSRCRPPKSDSAVREIAKWAGNRLEAGPRTFDRAAAAAQDNTEREERSLPEIKIGDRQLRDISAEVLAALTAANDPPKLFARAGALVRVDLTTEGGPVISDVTDVVLRGEMTRSANFFAIKKKKDGFEIIKVNPPLDVAKDLLSRPAAEWNLPELESIATAPFMRPDGTVVCSAGYDRATKTFYAPSGSITGFDVPDRPTADDVDAARALIEEVFVDFPFTGTASRANALALFITPEVRPAISGNVPLALVDAPQAGNGKSLVAEVVALKTTGAQACMKPVPQKRDPEEWRKNLTSTIRGGQPLGVFDNVDGTLDSGYLALALTSRTWEDRILGESALVTLPVRAVFVATGNNLTLGGDLPRRCYWVPLDAQTSEPWRDRTFKHPKLTAWVLNNRGRLLAAVLTLARAWFVAGEPPALTPILGSFEEWCRIIGGILQFAGVEGFLGNLDELYKNSDPTVAAWESFLGELLEQMPITGFTVADVIARLRDTQSSLRSILPEDLGDMEPLPGFQRRLGRAFVKRADRRYGPSSLCLSRMPTLKHGAVAWNIRQPFERVT